MGYDYRIGDCRELFPEPFAGPPWRLQRDHAAALFGVSDIEGQWILPAEHDHMDVQQHAELHEPPVRTL